MFPNKKKKKKMPIQENIAFHAVIIHTIIKKNTTIVTVTQIFNGNDTIISS